MTSSDLLNLSGRVALVTGAGQGVGRQIASTLADFGAKVIVNDFDLDRAKQVADEISAAGKVAIAAQADVGDFEQVNRMFTEHDLGPVSVVINNAGNAGAGPAPTTLVPFWEQEPQDWQRYLHVNLNGVMNVTRCGLAQMVPNGWGRIVTIISDAARVGETNGMEVYSGAKAGAAGFTRAMARLGGRHGVTANCIALGATRTPAIADAIQDEAFAKKVLSNYIVRRFGEPEDAANAVLFLASDASSFITGQTIPVNGGYSLAL
ncbi:SDR family NAD(P)-dependent oxidoreductase [Rhodococcus sp. OK302]|uniref:SDR family NAD(P)-dependent oxidoreductase n=1 Tax=Rhodococcus sp. OK302 TaxID=1882769 RepID=UPI000B945C4C|nr:SDR family NAD(P)-dependent oxidoreductase [Rhodococcus sp. OK302]OYD70355.1 3-oxoacyl-[acyl-carrier protein] reductase [Rhodococcus sp. OK302]